MKTPEPMKLEHLTGEFANESEEFDGFSCRADFHMERAGVDRRRALHEHSAKLLVMRLRKIILMIETPNGLRPKYSGGAS